MFGILSRIISAPVKIANLPLQAADVVLNAVGDGDEPILSAPLKAVADEIDETGDEMDDYE